MAIAIGFGMATFGEQTAQMTYEERI